MKKQRVASMKNKCNSFRKLAVSVAVSASLMVPAAFGLGLGEIDSRTSLNQPLQAEIVLLSARGFDEQDLTAKIASYEAYAKYGITKEPFHNQLTLVLETKANGSKVIKLSSREAIKEPFVNILVELNWPQGRLLREYTILLDPPVLSQATRPVQNKPVASSRRTVTRPTTRTQSNTSSRPSSEPRVAFTGDNWRVKRGDTLWQIAKNVRPEGASVQQTLAALYRNNPRAFINNDIDRLKAGVNLSVPASSTINSVSKSIGYKDLRSTSDSTSAPLDVRKTVADKPQSAVSETTGRLTISSVTDTDQTAQGGSQADADSLAAGSNLSSLQSQVESLSQENEELKLELEALKGLSDDGLAVEDDTLAVLTGAASAKQGADESLQDLVSDNLDEALAQETAEAKDSAESVGDAAAESLQDLVATAPDTDSPETSADKTADKVAAKPVAKTSKPEPVFWEKDSFWVWLLVGLAGLGALIGGGLFWKRRQREMDQDLSAFDNAYSVGSRAQPDMSDDSQDAVDSEIDPLVDADIQIARGHLDNAEVVLTDALADDPDNLMLKVKLMEVHASTFNSEKVHRLFNQLPDDFDHNSELGLKVASLLSLVGADSAAQGLDSEEVIGEDLASRALAAEEASSDADELELPSEDEIFGNDASELDLSEMLDDDGDLSDIDDEFIELSESVDFDLSNDEGTEGDDGSLTDEEAETKIDLARAYMEMGDDESAKDVLEEVEKEGSKKQKEAAADLLAKL